jgi:hypothetical protein
MCIVTDFGSTTRLLKPNPYVSPRLLTREVLAGLVVAMALIPEAISFSIIAGVDPRVGLFSSFVMAVSIAFLGGRPAMITAATGAIALVVAPLVRDRGLDYLIVAVILAGIFPIVLGLLGVAKLMRFIPRSVMVGFVNALAILILSAQLPNLIGVPSLLPLVCSPHHRRRSSDSHRGSHRRGRGRTAQEPAATVHRAHPGHLGDLRHHRPVLTGDRSRGSDGITDDGQARRRHHRHPFPQDS